MVYARRIEGRVLTFRVSGMLWRDSLVMRDRETGSLWSQVDGLAISGPMEGQRLQTVAATHTTWAAWRKEHPDSLVARKRWFDRKHRSDYESYLEDPRRMGLLEDRDVDPRLPGKTVVFGLTKGDESLAVPLAGLRRSDGIQTEIDGTSVLILPEANGVSASAFEVGEPSTMTEGDGTLRGRSLPRLPGQTIFWFAWSRFHPETRVLHASDATVTQGGTP